MVIKSRLMIFMIILTCVVSCCTVYGVQPEMYVEGTISLPDGKVAPAGGIKLRLVLESKKASISNEILIEEGKNSIAYSISYSKESKYINDEYILRCELITPVEGYNDVSYYIGDNEAPFEYFVKKLKLPKNYSNISTTLVESKKVKGTLLLPDGITADSDSIVNVNIVAQSDPRIVCDADPVCDVYFYKEVKAVIKKGENVGEFEVDLPLYSPGYYFNYELNDYISGVSPKSDNFTTRTRVLEDTSVEIQLDKGNIIKGKVSLPEGVVAQSGGYPVTVSALYYTSHLNIAGIVQMPNYIDKKVIIPEGANSVDYEITVYPKYSKYYVLYSIEGKEYIDKGYYSPTGTIDELDKDVYEIEVESDVENINLHLVKGIKLTGKIIHPYIDTAKDDLKGYLIVISDNQVFRKYPFTIKKGYSYANFELVIPTDLKDFVLKYETANTDMSPSSGGYYSDTGTTTYSSKAQKFDTQKGSINNLQFRILGYEKISGTLKLPEDLDSFEQTQVFEIGALDKYDDGNNSYKYNTLWILEAGERSSSFEIMVPESFDDVILYCTHKKYPDSNNSLIIDGYLGSDGMVVDKEDAIFINPGQPNSTGIEIVPICKRFGDLSNDGIVNSVDLAYFRGYLLGIYTSNQLILENVDINQDCQVDSIDFALMRKYFLGIINKLPV